MVKSNLTGAHYGIGGWLLQRVTALIMLLLLIMLLAVFVFIGHEANSGFVAWQSMLHQTWLKILMTIFFVSLLLHAWVGVRDIWMDYVQCTMLKLTLYTLTILWLVISFIYTIKVIW